MQLLYIMSISIKSVIASEFPEAQILSSGFTGSVYALSEHTVIKSLSQDDFDNGLLVCWKTNKDGFIPAEILAMKWANTVNSLVVNYVDHFHIEEVGYIIAMERLYPCLPTAFTRHEISAAINVAEAQLEELWASGWAHGDIRRPSMVRKGDLPIDVLYNNIMLTKEDVGCVIRLVDTGFSALEQYDEFDDGIDTWIAKDREDWRLFKEWILNIDRS